MDNGLHRWFCPGQQSSRRILCKPEQARQRTTRSVGDQYLCIKATHFDGELEGIALVLEGHNNTDKVALLSDCKPAIRVTCCTRYLFIIHLFSFLLHICIYGIIIIEQIYSPYHIPTFPTMPRKPLKLSKLAL